MHAILDNIIIEEPAPVENKTETGIVLQEKVNRDSIISVKVFSVGPEVKNVKEGETILIKAYTGDKFIYDKKDFRILSEKEIIAVL